MADISLTLIMVNLYLFLVEVLLRGVSVIVAVFAFQFGNPVFQFLDFLEEVPDKMRKFLNAPMYGGVGSNVMVAIVAIVDFGKCAGIDSHFVLPFVWWGDRKIPKVGLCLCAAVRKGTGVALTKTHFRGLSLIVLPTAIG
jgi:hypothetical protein